MINVQSLTKKYGDVVAVDNVSFNLSEGEIIGLLGPNGAGKTTILRILTSFLEPTYGLVQINDLNLDNAENKLKTRKIVGYLPESSPLYENMKVEEYLRFVAVMHGLKEKEIAQRLLMVAEKCGLRDKMDDEISVLSKGYKQRVGLAQALIHNPKILIMDEPTSGLDPKQRIEIRDLIKEISKDKTIILSSHILPEVQATCSRMLIINKGKIIADGTPEELESAEGGLDTVIVVLEEMKENLPYKIRHILGVEDVQILGRKLEIKVRKGEDLRPAISRAVAQEGGLLLELTKKSSSLEDIFLKLTE
ncbi:MAG: ATP-binding cassette domain-containing protein [Patescibacteria group bacterium]